MGQRNPVFPHIFRSVILARLIIRNGALGESEKKIISDFSKWVSLIALSQFIANYFNDSEFFLNQF